MRKTYLHSLLALLTALVMLLGSVPALAESSVWQITTEGSQWINSDIIGAVNENTVVSLKDDFHTAVNLDWFLTNKDSASTFHKAVKLIYDRKLDIVMGNAEIDPANADAIGLSSQWLEHDLDLVQTFSSLVGEWEYRNAAGVEPARPFIEAIASIKTMDELSDFMFNATGMNLSGCVLAELSVQADPAMKSTFMAAVKPMSTFSLTAQDQYVFLNDVGHTRRFGVDAAVQYLLEKLGYTEGEIKDILRRCYHMEGLLAENMKKADMRQTITYLTSGKKYSLEELTRLAGDYPIARQLELSGAQPQDSYLVFEPSYFRFLGSVYQPSHLEDLKAMLIVHNVCDLLPLLDEAAYDMAASIFDFLSSIKKPETGDPVAQPETELADRRVDMAKYVFDNYIKTYLPGPMDQIYVAAHCNPQLKSDMRALIDDILAYFREMFASTTWLSEKARNAAIEKLDNMVVRCVYPDSFVDYTGLTFKGYRNNEGGTLPAAIAAIKTFHTRRTMAKIGQAASRTEWDMSAKDMSTTVCNAFYHPTENSINLLAGYLTDVMYTPDIPYEKLLAVIGTAIGHEITHAFDTTGYKFDKDGNMNPWWSTQDIEAYDLRASNLIKYYDNIMPIPNTIKIVEGGKVSGEVIADMGGVKCMLNIAKLTPDFDYALFFKSYAELWRTVRSAEDESALLDMDPHPLPFLRTNVTLMQFDEFQQTFGIQPGDGMYLEPSKRINVW